MSFTNIKSCAGAHQRYDLCLCDNIVFYCFSIAGLLHCLREGSQLGVDSIHQKPKFVECGSLHHCGKNHPRTFAIEGRASIPNVDVVVGACPNAANTIAGDLWHHRTVSAKQQDSFQTNMNTIQRINIFHRRHFHPNAPAHFVWHHSMSYVISRMKNTNRSSCHCCL